MRTVIHSLAVVRMLAAVLTRRPDRPAWWRRRGDDGMTTAEYAVGTVAACAFAAVLYKLVTSGTVGHLLGEIIAKALHAI